MSERTAVQTDRASVRVEGAVKSFDGRVVVNVADLTLGAHPIEGLIGPNGAGKTTLIRMIMHTLKLDRGKVTYVPGNGSGEGIVLSDKRPEQIARLGVVKTNQVIQDFDDLTIFDSLMLSVTEEKHERWYKAFSEGKTYHSHAEEIQSYLDRFHFTDPGGFAGSAGEKKLLDIIRCLLLKPKILLLDEPTAGLPPGLRDRLIEMIREKATQEHISVVIVEHDLSVIWGLSNYVHFMAEGEVMLQGDPDFIRTHDTVIEKYLGKGHAGG
jgi:ABC-type branched-subunit amino acid transport system ATPase component